MHPTKSVPVKNYELTAIFAGSLKESELKKEIEKLEKELGKLGKIKNKTTWENRPLAYKIQQEITGTYFICEFSSEASKIPELESALRIDQKIIRSLIFSTPKSYEWKEYSSEDLEHDLHKIKPVAEKTTPKKISSSSTVKKFKTTAPKKKVAEETKTPKKEKTAEIDDKKLDDILDDL